MNELIGDSKRQAVHTLEAYSYQIWQSLWRWLNLREGEALFLEGAEDIDLHGPNGVTTIQVKAGAGTVSLRSKDILESIAHFWGHRLQNQGVAITFRFLSIAERGSERPNPFGNIKGLDLWDSCKHPGTNTQLLRNFLSAQEIFPQDLREFISNATDEELQSRLLLPIEWDTGNKALPFIKDSVERKVSDYGNHIFNLSHSESVRAIPHLLQYVWDVVRRRENRRLDPADFRREFEEAITERITRQERQRLMWAATAAAFGREEREVRRNRTPEIIFEPLRPLHNERLVQRKTLATDLLDKLNATGLLVLKGSTGMGKSTLGISVATADKASWHKLDLRGFEPEQIKDRLVYVAHLLEDNQTRADCVVDDLNFDRRPEVYENALAQLIYMVKLQSGRIIVTTQGSLPSRIISSFDLTPSSFVDVPLLTEEEVAELISKHGCPKGNRLESWRQVVYISTQGHPQLAHARVQSQAVRGWSQPSFDDLIASPGIDDVRREIRQRLKEQLASDAARTLLYRLSIFTKRFKRAQALSLGSLEPQVSIPGEAFDSLVGPWVEQVDEQHFRLSPLLENTAREVFSEAELIGLHRAAGASFLALREIDIFSFAALLTHGLAGRDKRSLGAATVAIFSDENVPWPELSNFISWFGVVKLEAGERLFEEDLFLSALLRRLQFKVASETKPSLAMNVAEAWEQEIRQLANEEQRLALLMRFLFDVTSADQVPFPLATFVNYLYEQHRLFKKSPQLLIGDAEEQDSHIPNLEMLANPRLFLFLAAKRCESGDDVVELLAALNKLTGEEVEELWQILNEDDYQAMLLIDRGWLQETRADVPDWQEYLESLSRALDIASNRGAKALIAAILRAKAIVLKEYCNDREGALAALDEGAQCLGSPHLFLQEYRAKIFFLEDSYNEALSIWRKVLSALEIAQNEARIYAYRDAATCAVKLGSWSEAADLFRRGSEAARLSLIDPPEGVEYQPDHLIEYCFRAEYAFASWKAGERTAAIAEFVALTNTFTHLPSMQENLKAHLLYRRIGHAVGWIGLEVNGGQHLAEPQAGWFTQLEIGDKVVSELAKTPIPPLTQLWYILARLEYTFAMGDSIFKRFEAEFSKAPVPMVTMSYYDLRLRHLIRQLKADNLISDYLRISAELRTLAKQQAQQITWTEAAELKQVLFATLTKFLCEDQKQAIPLSKWKQEIEKLHHLKDEVGAWLGLVEARLDIEPDKLTPILVNGKADSDHRALAALLLTVADSTDPETRFYANVLLVQSEYGKHWQDVFEGSLASVIACTWENIVQHQTFALRSPRLNCPAILSACRAVSTQGLRKIALILLSARNAVKTRIDSTVVAYLQQLVE